MWEETKDLFGDLLLPIFLIVIVVVLVFIIPIISIGYYSSCKQVNIYNGQNNTEYTCSDFFWASEQINSESQTVKIKY